MLSLVRFNSLRNAAVRSAALRAIASVVTAVSLSGCFALLPLVDTETAAKESEAKGYREHYGESYANARDVPLSSSGSYTRGYTVPCDSGASGRDGSCAPQGRRTTDRSSLLLKRYLVQLRDKQAAVRATAATSIGLLGPKATVAVQPLILALNDQDKFVRRAAVKSLAKIGSREAVEPIRRKLQDRDKYVAHSAARALQTLQR